MRRSKNNSLHNIKLNLFKFIILSIGATLISSVIYLSREINHPSEEKSFELKLNSQNLKN